MIQAVLFDLDLTLLDREKTYRAFAYDLVSRYTKDPVRTERLAEEMIRLDRHGYGSPGAAYRPLMEAFGCGAGDFAGQWALFVQKVVYRYPESEAVLRELSGRYRLGIVSNGASATQWGKLHTSGLAGYFETVVISGDVGIEKPDPEIFRIALAKMRLSADEAVFIGDHPLCDGIGALDAGMRVVWIDHGLHSGIPDGVMERLRNEEGRRLIRIPYITGAADAVSRFEKGGPFTAVPPRDRRE